MRNTYKAVYEEDIRCISYQLSQLKLVKNVTAIQLKLEQSEKILTSLANR